jgi:drug/metabolite transporter (DMT)-like permease
MLLTFFEPFLYFIGESKGMVYVPASYGAVIISLIPLITPVFAWFIIREPITRCGIWGTVISFLGVVVIVLEKEEGEATLKGVAFLTLAVMAAVSYGMTLRQTAREYKPATIVMVQTILGMIYFLPVFLIFEGKRFFSAMPPLEAYYPVIGLAVFCTCGAFLLFTYSIRKIGLNNANIFSNMIPVFTVILAYLFIQEAVSVRKVMGILIVVSGLFLSQLPALRQRRLS